MEVTHIPKGSMCSNCQHGLVRNCSHLDFSSMPQIEKNKDGVVVVKCGDFVKFESNQDAWPEDISDHPHDPTIIQGGVVDSQFKRIQLALNACENFTDEDLEKGKFSEIVIYLLNRAVTAEREACAELLSKQHGWMMSNTAAAMLIRARGSKKMIEFEHTAKQWRLVGDGEIVGSDNNTAAIIVEDSNAEANARRILACLNACNNISTEELENTSSGVALFGAIAGRLSAEKSDLLRKIRDIEMQRDELLAAVQVAADALEAISGEMTVGDVYSSAGQYLIDAIPVVRSVISCVKTSKK